MFFPCYTVTTITLLHFTGEAGKEAGVKNFCILSDALDCVESRLGEDLSPQQVAEECHCSLSSLQKLFRYVFHISVADYISRRRMTCCARELITTGKSILDIAMDYGYHSPEVFTRAFARVWGTTPAAFRKNRRFSGLFPKFDMSEYDLGGISVKTSFTSRAGPELKGRHGKQASSRQIL